MNYKSNLKIKVKDSYEIIKKRADFWAKKYKFKKYQENENEIIYKRGSHLRVSCSFDVRYIPSTVTIKLKNEEIEIIFHAKSIFYHAFPSDSERIDEQTELLSAYIKGAFDENLNF